MELKDQKKSSAKAVRSTPVQGRPLVQVLYIDGNEEDLILTQLACERCHASFNFWLARSVQEAISGLKSAQANEKTLPDLILLEIMTDGHKGFEVLKFVAANPRLSRIPVVVYTGTTDPVLLGNAQRLGAKCVLTKEANLGSVIKLVAFATNIGLCA